MKKNHILIAAIIALVCGYLLCEHVYDEKYDEYVRVRQEEYVKGLFDEGTLKLIVSIDEDEMEYHHLGTDISIKHTCNGRVVSSGDVVPMKKKMNFKTVITEHDDSSDDVGEGTAVLSVNSSGKGKAYTTVTVEERGGRRYKDAYAKWSVTYSVAPDLSEMPDIGYWEVIFS